VKIDQLKINSYGKLKNKEINLNDNINIIYGENESGKSTLLKFMMNSLYGISKNKKGKEFSDFDRYNPWKVDEFSGKISYMLDNQKRFEVFRDFKKKNPKIFNENMEDISNQFNIDKVKGNEFFYEQTKMDEELFLSTLVVGQQEIRLEKQEQNVLIQKIANLVGTGDDNVSYKRAMDRINKRQLDEIGSQKSREKPINILQKEIEEISKQKIELDKYKEIRYNLEENKNEINNEIFNLEKENSFLKENKIIIEKEKIEKEKINIKENMEKENVNKINLLKNKLIDEKRNKEKIINENLEKNKNKENEKNKINNKLILIFILVIIINIVQFIYFKNIILKSIFLLIVPMFLIFWIFIILNKNKKIKIEKNKNKKIENEINMGVNSLENEINLLEANNKELKNEINKLINNLNLKNNLEKEKIKNNYLNKIEFNKINKLINLENINTEIEILQNKINNKKIELHTLGLDKRNIEPKLDELSKIEEKMVNNNQMMLTLKDLNLSMDLAKEVLNIAYEEMKSLVTPKFTSNLSQTISEITNGKYTNIRVNDEMGLVIEMENGNYEPASKLSMGTIDQLYLSLRLSMAEELSEEKMPIILDEVFAYYDTNRLRNILKYINTRFNNHQIIIFTCTNREKEILEDLNIDFNLVEL